MRDVHVTELKLRRVRAHACKETGARPGHLSEAIAAGLGHRTHAALVEALRNAPWAAMTGTWDEKAALDRLVCLGTDPDHAKKAINAAGYEMVCGTMNILERVSGLLGRVSDAGGGTVNLERKDWRTLVSIGLHDGIDHHTTVSEPYEGVSVEALVTHIMSKVDKERVTHFYEDVYASPLPPTAIGLPRDNVPAFFQVKLSYSDHCPSGISIRVPPRLGVHAGVRAIGLPAETERAIAAAMGPVPGLRLISSHWFGPRRAVALVAATECAGRAGVTEVHEWAQTGGLYDLSGSKDDEPARSAFDRTISGLLTEGVRGRVIILPNMDHPVDVEAATRLVEAGASVWSTCGALRADEQPLARCGAQPGLVRLAVDVPTKAVDTPLIPPTYLRSYQRRARGPSV